jgi:hypothetical protein
MSVWFRVCVRALYARVLAVCRLCACRAWNTAQSAAAAKKKEKHRTVNQVRGSVPLLPRSLHRRGAVAGWLAGCDGTSLLLVRGRSWQCLPTSPLFEGRNAGAALGTCVRVCAEGKEEAGLWSERARKELRGRCACRTRPNSPPPSLSVPSGPELLSLPPAPPHVSHACVSFCTAACGVFGLAEEKRLLRQKGMD